MQLVLFLLARLREASTYAGIATVLAAAGIHFSDAQWNAYVQAAMALAGVLAVLIPEGKGTPVPTGAPSGTAGAALIALLAASGITLAACNGTQLAQADTAIADAAPDYQMACWALSAAEAGLDAFAKSGKLDANAVKVAAEVRAGIDPLCAGPVPTNAADVVAKVMAAAAQVGTLAVPQATAAR